MRYTIDAIFGAVADEHASDLTVALQLASLATTTAMAWFGTGLQREMKSDGTPVCEADIAVERALLDLLRAERPADAVISEEIGVLGSGRRRWILDPIDGTAQFMEGKHGWGTHIALEVDGQLTVAVMTRPTKGLRWWAVRDGGTYRQEGDSYVVDRLLVSRTNALSRARIGGNLRASSVASAAVSNRVNWIDVGSSPVVALLERRLDAVLDDGGYIWDHAPAVLLVTEAGGRFRDPTGGGQLNMLGGLYTNTYIDDELIGLLGKNLPGPSDVGSSDY